MSQRRRLADFRRRGGTMDGWMERNKKERMEGARYEILPRHVESALEGKISRFDRIQLPLDPLFLFRRPHGTNDDDNEKRGSDFIFP
jgi:hypothetical protein